MLSTIDKINEPLPVQLFDALDPDISATRGSKIHALMVDDSDEDLRLLSMHLANIDHIEIDSTPVHSLREAELALRDMLYDVVFLDLGLPESNGPSTVTKFISLSNTIPIVVITGYDDEETGTESVFRGAQDYICKDSLNASVISASMRHAIERQKLLSQMDRLLSDHPVPTLIIDCDNFTKHMNPAAVEFFGDAASKVIGNAFPVNIYTADDTIVTFDLAEGQKHTFKINVKPTLWAGNRCFLASLSNITDGDTDWRLTEDKVEETAITKETFLENISLELKSPINTIIGFSDLLLGVDFGSLQEDLFTDYMATIRDNGAALDAQISDLLELSRMASNSSEYIFSDMDLKALIAKAIKDATSFAETHNVTLQYEQPSDDIGFIGDASKLKLMLHHLLSNAIKFSPANGRVLVTLSQNHSEIYCIISDTGCGISGQDINRVVKPFEKGMKFVSKTLHPSAGVGLALAEKIVQLHGGVLGLIRNQEAGTSAILRLPLNHIIV